MEIINRIVGLVPTVSRYAQATRDFVTSTKGHVALIAALVVVVALWAHHTGANSKAAEIAKLNSQLAEAQSQLADVRSQVGQAKLVAEISKQDADAAQRRAGESAEATNQLQQKVNDYERELKSRKAPGCVATDADVRSLQRIK